MLVALKLQYGIDDMLQYLRTGETALFGDMSYNDERNVALFGYAHDFGSTLPHLTQAADGTLHLGLAYCLNGVDDDNLGLQRAHLLQDAVEVGLAHYIELVVAAGDTFRPQFQLPCTLFA